MTAVNFKSTLSKDERPYNGLEAIADRLIDKPHEEITVVGRMRVSKIAEDFDGGKGKTPTVKWAHVEVVDGDDEDAVRRMLDARYMDRTGRESLPPDALEFGDGDGGPASPPKDEWLDGDNPPAKTTRGRKKA